MPADGGSAFDGRSVEIAPHERTPGRDTGGREIRDFALARMSESVVHFSDRFVGPLV